MKQLEHNNIRGAKKASDLPLLYQNIILTKFAIRSLASPNQGKPVKPKSKKPTKNHSFFFLFVQCQRKTLFPLCHVIVAGGGVLSSCCCFWFHIVHWRWLTRSYFHSKIFRKLEKLWRYVVRWMMERDREPERREKLSQWNVIKLYFTQFLWPFFVIAIFCFENCVFWLDLTL